MYLKRNRQMQDFISQASRSNDLKFISSDVVSDYFSLMGIELEEIKRTGSYIEVRFSNFSTLKQNANYSQILSDYQEYLMAEYANDSNKVINIDDLQPRFYLSPYNATFYIPDEKLYIYTVVYDELREIQIDLVVNQTNADYLSAYTTEPVSAGGTYPMMRVKVYDKDNVLLINSNVKLDSISKNTPIYLRFNRTSYYPNLTIKYGNVTDINVYGRWGENNGTLLAEEKRLEAKITYLSVQYDVREGAATLRTYATMSVS